jgi:hypothetical protein
VQVRDEPSVEHTALLDEPAVAPYRTAGRASSGTRTANSKFDAELAPPATCDSADTAIATLIFPNGENSSRFNRSVLETTLPPNYNGASEIDVTLLGTWRCDAI